MTVLLVGLSLSAYGLVRFGYGSHRTADRASSRPSHPAPPVITLKDHNIFGMATKTPIVTRMHQFSQAMGRRPDIVEFYNVFGNPFPDRVTNYLARQNILPLIQLNPKKVSLPDIIAGKYDSYLRGYADKVRKYGARIGISFGHEMNGWWYPWSLRLKHTLAQQKTVPANFVQAWRHIVDVFNAEHASNVIWIWTISRDGTFPGWPPLEAWWPGSRYVTWVGMDGYYRRPNETFSFLFGRQLAAVAKFTKKPVLITETAVTAKDPNDASQIQELLAGIQTPANRLMGFIWFDIDADQHWNIDHSPAEIALVRKALARYRYH